VPERRPSFGAWILGARAKRSYDVAQPMRIQVAVSMALPVRKDRQRAAQALITVPLAWVGPAT